MMYKFNDDQFRNLRPSTLVGLSYRASCARAEGNGDNAAIPQHDDGVELLISDLEDALDCVANYGDSVSD